MLFAVFINLLVIFLLLCVTEFLWRSGRLHVEVSRKIIHMGTGVVIAFWPYFLDWTTIQLLTAGLLVVVLISSKLHIFKSIHSVDRLTRGEILYPIGIGLCALSEPVPWIFAAAVLHLALADGIAALAGVRYGHRTRYTIISHGKSVIGSAAFFVTSLIIFVSASFLVSQNALPHIYAWFILSSLALTLVENLSWYGLDDVTVPVSVIVILTTLTT